MRLQLVTALLALAPWCFSADKVETPANEWHGTVGCAKCDGGKSEECLPSIKTDSMFLLKPGQNAPPAIKEFLARIQQGEMKGEYLVKGELSETEGKKWIAVNTMVAKPLPQKESGSLTYNRKKPDASTNQANQGQGGTTAAGQGGGTDQGGGKRGGRGRRQHEADQGEGQ